MTRAGSCSQRALCAALLAWLLTCIASTGRAQDASDEQGFADAAPNSATAAPTVSTTSESRSAATPSAFHLSGTVGVQSALRLEREGADRLGKLRLLFAPRLESKHELGASSLSLVVSGRAEADFAYLLRPSAYDAPTMEIYGSQLIPGATYLSIASEGFELAFGEQIVNLGQSEVLTLLDVVNPRDLREPLFADLDELRLPVLMTRVGLSFAALRGELLLVHEPSFGLLPPPMGEFSPLRKFLLDQPGAGALLSQHTLRYRHEPGRDPTQFGATQLHARVTLHVTNADLTLQAASVLDALGVPVFPTPRQLLRERIDLVTYHPRYTLLGQAGTISVGAFLLRWELAAELLRPFVVRSTRGGFSPLSSERLHTLRVLLGVTYVPTARTSVALELLQSSVLKPHAERALLFPVEATQLALRVSHQFLRERATFTLVVLCIGLTDFNALAGRAELSYALTDDLRIAIGAVSYQPSHKFGPFYGFERNDRAYANLRWSFAAN